MSATATPETSAIDTDKPKDAQKPVAPPETPQEARTRRAILVAFWVVVIFLGLPYWYWTTSIYRAQLDSSTTRRWVDGKACSLRYRLNIGIADDAESVTYHDTFAQELQRLVLSHPDKLYDYHVQTRTESSGAAPDFSIRLQSTKAGSQPTLQDWGTALTVPCDLADQSSHVQCATNALQAIQNATALEQASIAYILRDTTYGNVVNFNIEDEHQLEKRSTRAFKYASSYHLTFSLITATSKPSAWDIETALKQYIQPLLTSLSVVSNFTVDTQVQLFSSFSSSMAGPQFDEKTAAWQLARSDLSGFINAAEWPLNPSVDAGPTINFVLYIPPSDKTPLLVPESSTNSWIIPQWGGVQILNRGPTASQDSLSTAELESAMYTFANQLTSLVGLPPQPTSLQLRINALARERIASLIVSSSDTLGALIRLAEKLDQIAIPESVAQGVADTVSDLERACARLEDGHFQEALTHARHADEAVEKAFFEPSMVGQVYFPDEHKVAVYVPLLGPMAVPLIMATIKEIRQLRQRKVKMS